MSTKHTVTFPDGTTAKRTSANRVYPFAVAVSPETKAERVKWLEGRIESESAHLAEYTEVCAYIEAGGELVTVDDFALTVYAVNLAPRKLHSFSEQRRGQRAVGMRDESRETIADKYAGYAESEVKTIVALEAELTEVKAGPDVVGAWLVAGWQSRADLAATQQRKMQAAYPMRTAVVVETTYTN